MSDLVPWAKEATKDQIKSEADYKRLVCLCSQLFAMGKSRGCKGTQFRSKAAVSTQAH